MTTKKKSNPRGAGRKPLADPKKRVKYLSVPSTEEIIEAHGIEAAKLKASKYLAKTMPKKKG